MSFQQFTFPQVATDLGLTWTEAALFGTVPPVVPRPDFADTVLEGVNLASAINTEKARSEFVVAPVLFELRRMYPGRFGLFSGVELNADSSRGLNGICDFLITRSPRQFAVSLPILAVVEAKNENLRAGLGQCIATMTAAAILNDGGTVFGVVTSGTLWNFLRLSGSELVIDHVEYHIDTVHADNLGKVLGILSSIVADGGS